MRYRWSPLTMVLTALLALPALAQQEPIHWHNDLESAKSMAKASNRLVLIHFWTPTCGPCAALEQNVFNQPGVSMAIESKFVPVKLNADENSATAQWYGINRVPTDVVVTPDGQMVGKLISPPTPLQYVTEVTELAAKYAAKTGGAYDAAVAAAPAPSQLNAAYAALKVSPNTPLAIAPPSADPNQNRNSLAAMNGGPLGYGATHPPANGTTQFRGANGLPPIPGASPASPPMFSSASTAPTNALPSYPALATQPAANSSFAPNSAATVSSQTISNPAAMGGPVSAQAPITSVGQPAAAPAPAPVNNPYFPATMSTPSAQQSYVPPTAPMPAAPMISAAAAQVPQIGVPYGGASGSQASAPSGAAATNASVPASVPDPSKLPPGSPPLGFEGYCPVTMRNAWKWAPGNPQWGIVHRGRTYWFAGPEEQKQFWIDPDRYTPALSGMDPVLKIDHNQEVPGKRDHSLDFDGMFYMFASEATLQQFTANPQRYAAGVRQAMGIPRGRLVR
jgi:YHS domain-containing protein/thiol-disulfide isomerase/thioredoxin